MSVEHKRPLYAFAVLAIACGLFLGHAIRSEALVGYFRAVVVAVAPLAPATQDEVKEPEPAPATNLVAPAASMGQAVVRAPAASGVQRATTSSERHAKSASDTRRRDHDPARTPTDVPADEPTDVPADKPTEIPADKPTDTVDTEVIVPPPPPPAAPAAPGRHHARHQARHQARHHQEGHQGRREGCEGLGCQPARRGGHGRRQGRREGRREGGQGHRPREPGRRARSRAGRQGRREGCRAGDQGR